MPKHSTLYYRLQGNSCQKFKTYFQYTRYLGFRLKSKPLPSGISQFSLGTTRMLKNLSLNKFFFHLIVLWFVSMGFCQSIFCTLSIYRKMTLSRN